MHRQPQRILVAGASGAGKTTLAARIAAATGSPHVEIDGLYWQPGWTPNPDFVVEVEALAARERWVTEFQYRQVQPLLARRAELLVWIRLPRSAVLARVVRRTVRRRMRRELLWGSNQEPPLWTLLTDRDHIIRWSMRSFSAVEDRVRDAARADPSLRIVTVRSSRDVTTLLARLRAGSLVPGEQQRPA